MKLLSLLQLFCLLMLTSCGSSVEVVEPEQAMIPDSATSQAVVSSMFPLKKYFLGSTGYARDFASADFNNDGNIDAATIGGGKIHLFINNGDATFTLGSEMDVNNNAYYFTINDFNGDGFEDIAAAIAQENNVEVFLNNGDGTFPAAPNDTFAAGTFPYSIASADMDGDSDIDLIYTSISSQQVTIALNNGSGDFTAQTPSSPGLIPDFVNLSDIDGDSDLDVVITCENSHHFAVYFNDGSGGLGVATTYATSSPASLAFADFDNDSIDELALISGGSNFRVYENNGSGVFSLSQTTALGNTGRTFYPLDYDNDGSMDIMFDITQSNQQELRLYSGNGDNTFNQEPGKMFSIGH